MISGVTQAFPLPCACVCTLVITFAVVCSDDPCTQNQPLSGH